MANRALRIYREPGSIRGWWRHRSLFDLSFRPGLALALCQFSDDYGGGRYSAHVHLGWPNIYLTLPWRVRRPVPIGEIMLNWGFSLVDDAIHFNWGERCKIVHLPWSWDWVRTSYLMADGSWLHELRSDRPALNPKSPYKDNFRHYEAIRDKREAGQWREEHPYRYTLRSGEVQERIATISVDEAERRRRWLRWTSLFSKVTRGIDVRFNDEVGERTGSWKGGCIGCGYTMRPGETPEQTLRRMEQERKF